MTHLTADEQRQDGDVVAKGQDGEAVEEVAGVDTAAPHLAAIQHSYEEAKACIVDFADPLSYTAADCSEPHPETEKIDVRAVKPPVVPVTTAGTEAMSVAASLLAEQLAVDEVRSPAGASRPGPERLTASCPTDHGPRRWWRALRTALNGAVPAPRSDP